MSQIKVESEYYEKTVHLEKEEAEVLISIYLEIAKSQKFEPEATSWEELSDPHVYDHVAYHVENFGENHGEYDDIRELFDVEDEE